MYSKNCGKSHTDTNHANAIRHCQHAGEQEGWEPRSCDFQVQRWMQTVLLEVHENIAATPCIGIASESIQSTVFLVVVPRRDIKILSSHGLHEIRLPRILSKNTCALKTPPRNAAFFSSSFLPTANNLHSKQLSTPKNLFSTVSVSS